MARNLRSIVVLIHLFSHMSSCFILCTITHLIIQLWNIFEIRLGQSDSLRDLSNCFYTCVNWIMTFASMFMAIGNVFHSWIYEMNGGFKITTQTNIWSIKQLTYCIENSHHYFNNIHWTNRVLEWDSNTKYNECTNASKIFGFYRSHIHSQNVQTE